MARTTERSLAAVYAALALSAGGVASAQEVALAQDSPEARFLMDAVRGDIAETKMGELAQQKGQSEGVRAFGEMLVEDHSSAMKKTAELAKDLKVIPPAAEMTKAHQETIAKYEMQARSGDSDVAEHAEELLPVLREHLATAQALQSGGDASHDQSSNHDRSDN